MSGASASRIEAATVRTIRTEAAGGARVVDLARRHGISRQACDRIVRGVSFRDAGGPIPSSGYHRRPVAIQTILAAAVCAVRHKRAFSVVEIAEVLRVPCTVAAKRVGRLTDRGYLRSAQHLPGHSELTEDGRKFLAEVVSHLKAKGKKSNG